MTAIKQKSVSNKNHGRNLMKYFGDKRGLLRDTQNLINPHKWYSEMELTRKEFGHDKARALAKNTIIYHQMLNFLPDECDVNGGLLTPELCMKYAKEYALTYYPNHQIAFVLHKEHRTNDDVYSYTVHMAINRTNLSTGNRLDEGKGNVGKRKRAKQVRDMDDKWDLSQLKEGVKNSKVHDKQPDRIEREIDSREGFSYKMNLRDLMDLAKDETADIDEWIDKLVEWGVGVSVDDGNIYIIDPDHDKYSFRTDKLKYGFDIDKLSAAFGDFDHQVMVAAKQMKREISEETIAAKEANIARQKYQDEIERLFSEYEKMAIESDGMDFDVFPVFTIPRRTQIHNTMELNLLTIALKQKADELRFKYSSNTPLAKQKDGNVGSITSREKSNHRDKAHEQFRDNPGIKR